MELTEYEREETRVVSDIVTTREDFTAIAVSEFEERLLAEKHSIRAEISVECNLRDKLSSDIKDSAIKKCDFSKVLKNLTKVLNTNGKNAMVINVHKLTTEGIGLINLNQEIRVNAEINIVRDLWWVKYSESKYLKFDKDLKKLAEDRNKCVKRIFALNSKVDHLEMVNMSSIERKAKAEMAKAVAKGDPRTKEIVESMLKSFTGKTTMLLN